MLQNARPLPNFQLLADSATHDSYQSRKSNFCHFGPETSKFAKMASPAEIVDLSHSAQNAKSTKVAKSAEMLKTWKVIRHAFSPASQSGMNAIIRAARSYFVSKSANSVRKHTLPSPPDPKSPKPASCESNSFSCLWRRNQFFCHEHQRRNYLKC